MNSQSKFDEFHRQSWSQIAKDPNSWFSHAKNLKCISDVLRKNFWPQENKLNALIEAENDFSFGPVYMLISGLAIETLIKGIIISLNPNLVEGQKLSKDLAIHDIVELFRKTRIAECKGDKDLLSRLQNYVVIFGRYPVTKSEENMAKRTNTRFCRTDLDKVDRFWKRLLKNT